MAKVVGSICNKCYAMRGHYHYPVVLNAQERRYQAIHKTNWVSNMVIAINGTNTTGFFRHFDSGDLQGVWHLKKIVAVCEQTPQIQHWLPTREIGFVSQYLKEGGKFPSNLTVRISSAMIDGLPPVAFAKRNGLNVSAVTKTNSFTCPSSKQDGECKDCRACWDKKTFSVSYKYH